MITLERTCWACPEQYDAYRDDKLVGYLRLRHGYFHAECPDVGGLEVYSAQPDGDGTFDDEERDYYLRFAVAAILHWLDTGEALPQARLEGPPPEVQFEVVQE